MGYGPGSAPQCCPAVVLTACACPMCAISRQLPCSLTWPSLTWPPHHSHSRPGFYEGAISIAEETASKLDGLLKG